MRSHSRRFGFPGTTPPIGITLLLRRCAPSFYPDRDREKTATGCPRLVRGSLTLVAITRCDERLWTGSPRGGSRLLLAPEADSKEREPPPLKAVASSKVERLTF